MADESRPARYVYQIYVYAVCFVTILILLFTAASFAYALVRIAAPGTTAKGGFGGGFSFLGSFADAFSSGGGGERDRGLVQLTQSGLLGIASGALFYVHWGWARGIQAAADRAERFRAAPAKRKPSRPRKAKAAPAE